ncbi:helicase [Cryobacterium sp. TmT2-59]|uniref:DEAD/DEAH box helicase n=1 Tax=Cryobacterium sp. TmT2-59 TaxID=1259264 RepID=UPI00106B852E|nr:DEAD/DEAH box helicase [Cryobacterium sp. TmT2-59]TFC88906.1 helicase [Cryobacterium sp. TmT2-59]
MTDAEIDVLRSRITRLEQGLAEARSELGELERARDAMEKVLVAVPARAGLLPAVTAASSSAEKLALFRARFVGRNDVHAVRWTSARTGKSGWAPAVRGGFYTGSETAADYLPLEDRTVERHLRGASQPGEREFHVGLYPMVEGDQCRLLVCDFDDAQWRHDATAFVAECERARIDVLTEVSRSGEGAHVWIFFEDLVPAATARTAGMRLLRAAMARRPTMDFQSYDRFFPSQDTLPERSTGRARLGNLIALPLQGDCPRRGTTVFVDPGTWDPYEDQFAALAMTTPVPVERVAELGSTSLAESRVGPAESLGARPRRSNIKAVARTIAGRKLGLRRDAFLHIPTEVLPGILITELKHMASLPNPEFYRRQAQRFSTFGTPRLVTSFEHDEHELRLPRGLADEAEALLADAGFQTTTETVATAPACLEVTFAGQLRDEQLRAVDALLAHDTGVLVAPPGAGKTVMACALIAERATPTAILVNRAELLAQWRERLQQFLGLTEKQIGQLGAGRRKQRGVVDLIMMQSVAHRNADPSTLEEYGQIIIDECHAVAAPATEAALRNVNVRYWVGMTATPYRADQMNGLITMQCGPIRHVVDTVDHAAREMVVHETTFRTEEPGIDGPSVQAIYSELAADAERNEMITGHVRGAADQGRTCLVLTNRLQHLDVLADALESCASPVIRLHGRLTAANRRDIRRSLEEMDAQQQPFVLVAIDKIAGEGLDLPTLNTLFLTVPVSFKGRVIQQIGRITRGRAEHSMPAIVHDYRDKNVPILERMYSRRRRVMSKEGFVTAEPAE